MIPRPVWIAFTIVALAYIGLCAWMYAAQRRLVYFPQFTRADAAATDFALEHDGVVLRGWVVNPGRPRAVVYFGGNGESVQDNRALFERWLPGHSVYLMAYRGYGASDGQPSQPSLLADALAVFDYVQRAHPGHPVSLVGRSLGSGVASHVASQRPIGRLALVTPFDSLAAVAQAHYPWLPVRWLLQERYDSVAELFPVVEERAYDSVAALAGYRGPLLVVRAGRDEVVPPANTDRLVAALPRPPQVVAMPRAGHNALDEAAYGRALGRFFEETTTPR